MTSNTHIIGRQKVSVRYRGKTEAQSLREMVHRVCRNELPARLTQLLDRLDDPSVVIRIKRIDVELNMNDDGHLEEKLGRALVEEIEKTLRRQLQDRITQKHPAEQSFGRTLSFYLKNGFLPWWSLFKEREGFYATLKEAWSNELTIARVWLQIRETLKEPTARKRLLDLIDLKMFEQLGLASSVFDTSDWRNVVESIVWLNNHFHTEHPHHSFLRKAQSILLSILARQHSVTLAWMMFDEEFVRLIKSENAPLNTIQLSQIPSTHVRSVLLDARMHVSESKFNLIERNEDEGLKTQENHLSEKLIREEIEIDEAKGISVQNAGLVLIASYLPRFLENLGLVENNIIREPSKAAIILRRLVFPEGPFEEFELVLEKLLCGIPLRESIADIPIDEIALKEASDELLNAVIDHWKVLKNTSPDGLRQAFLQREGRLTETDKHWNLEVQKASYDLLLEHLPWNFRMIKLPWMNKLLQVSWD